jgi:hypothetical protein
MYKKLDPAADWDAFCNDHPEIDVDIDDVDEEDYQSACCHADIEVGGFGYRCTQCGQFCEIDAEYTIEQVLKRWEAEAEEEKAVAAYERRMSSQYDF